MTPLGDSKCTAMLSFAGKSNGMCIEAGKLRLDFVGAPRLRRRMSGDADKSGEVVLSLFYLITVAAEDAATLAVEGQLGLLQNAQRADLAARLRTFGETIETLASAIDLIAGEP